MSLTDLKRQLAKKKPKSVSIEDFIEDANNYAQGKPSKIGAKSHGAKKTAEQAKQEKHLKQFRHATFTLTEQSISQLDELSQQTGIAKSKLLRMFIANFADLNEEQQQQLRELCGKSE